jgi:glucokinase
MTLDAGGTNFRFCAMRGGVAVTETVTMASHGHDLQLCLANIIGGFAQVRAKCPSRPVAISFAFPGPADYPNGIIGNLGNLPGFRGGVALGPMLEDKFGVPVFINNDGDLFAYGEAMAGFLPYVNNLLEKTGNQKRYKNLFGVTLGTGFGGGIVHAGKLFVGDNSMAGEVWLLRNKIVPQMNAEEGACIRALRRTYATGSGITFEQSPDPRVIEQIALLEKPGNGAAAMNAFRQMGEVVGDAIGNALALVDGLAVIGGGLSNGNELFLPAVIEELNGFYTGPDGQRFNRLASRAFNLEEPSQLAQFLNSESREIFVPGSDRRVKYDPISRIGVGISRLGTSEAIAMGAYIYALNKLT